MPQAGTADEIFMFAIHSLFDFCLQDRLLFLATGLMLDSIVGEMPWFFARFPHPVVLIGRLITTFDVIMNCPERHYTTLQWRGLFTVIVIIGAAAVTGIGGHWLSRTIPCAWGLEVLCIGVLLAQRSLYQHVAEVAHRLVHGGLQEGRLSVAKICGRDPNSLNESGVVRSAIESCAENLNDGVIAPTFWYSVFGLPGLCVYKATNTLDSMIGHCNERYRAFGFAAARLDDVLNWIPSRLSGLFIAGAALCIPKARPLQALTTMVRDAKKHRSPNAGWPEAAMAGALGLSLAGPRCYSGHRVADSWIGANGREEAAVCDISRALHVFVLACVINAIIVLMVLSFLYK